MLTLLTPSQFFGDTTPVLGQTSTGIGVPDDTAAQSRNRKSAAFCIVAPFMVAHSRSLTARQLLLRSVTGTPTRMGCRPDWRLDGSCLSTDTSEATMASHSRTAAIQQATPDAHKLRNAVEHIDCLAQSGLMEISTFAKLALAQLERPSTLRNPEDLAVLLNAIWQRSDDILDQIMNTAGDIGCNYVDDAAQRRALAAYQPGSAAC